MYITQLGCWVKSPQAKDSTIISRTSSVTGLVFYPIYPSPSRLRMHMWIDGHRRIPFLPQAVKHSCSRPDSTIQTFKAFERAGQSMSDECLLPGCVRPLMEARMHQGSIRWSSRPPLEQQGGAELETWGQKFLCSHCSQLQFLWLGNTQLRNPGSTAVSD